MVKIGDKGSMIKKGDKVFKAGVIDVTPIDTTGAGDIYASGFLYGMVNNLSLDKCGEIGALLSGRVIENTGAKLFENQWDEIKELIEKIEKA